MTARVALTSGCRLPEEGNKRSRARELLSEPDLAVLTLEVFRAAVSISRRFGLSYWDGASLTGRKGSGVVPDRRPPRAKAAGASGGCVFR